MDDEYEAAKDFLGKWGGKLSRELEQDIDKLARRIRDAKQARIDELENLLCHAWIHSSYLDCGRNQMTTPQKAQWDALKDKWRRED